MSENTPHLHDTDAKMSLTPPEQSPRNPNFPANFKFSPEELKVLEECNSESFYQRCLPLSTVFAMGAFYGVQKGYLRPNPRFGPTPKVLLGVVIGYILGKFSYQKKCIEKLMAIPDSQVGSMLRQKIYPQWRGRSAGSPMFDVNPNDVYSDAGPGSSLDLDTERPLFAGLSEFDRNVEINVHEKSQDQPSAAMTYDELRKKNREDQSNLQNHPYRMNTPTPPPVVRPRTSASSPKNKYGDTVED